jgi:outer membrane protein OmpA-like peptidoglycan-associated protein
MSATILDTLAGLLTPDMIGRAASALGESEPAVSKGMSAVFPVLLSSVANRAGDADFASTLFNLVRDPANDGSLLGDVASLLGPGASSSPMMALGGKLLGSLFGNNLGSLASSLGGYAGVKPAASHSMLSVAAPLLLSVLGKAVKSGNLNLSSLIGMLTGQKDSYAKALPGPLSRLDGYFASPVRAAYAAPPPVEEKKSIWRWLLPLLIALAALWLLSRCMGPKETVTQSVETVPAPVVESAPAPAPMPAPEPMPAPAAEAAPAAEIPLANYYFEVDQFALPVAREGSLEAVIAYLKANPTAVASVSGYHDPTGDAAHNEELARKRATAVKDAMTAAGIPDSQIDMVKPIVTTGSGDLAEARRVEVAIRR